MKKLNLFSRMCSPRVGAQKDESSTRLRVVFDSFTCRLRVCPLKLVSVLAILLTIGVGNVWGGNHTWSYTFASGNLSTSSGNKTFAGKIDGSTNKSVTWACSAATYIGWNDTKGIQIGSGASPQKNSAWTMQTAISNIGSSIKITSITINVAVASSGGGKYILSAGTATSGASGTAFSNTSNGNKTYNITTDITSGNIVISLQSTTNKAMYIKSVSIGYADVGGASTCATPTFSPAAGSFCGSTSVTLSCATDGATIRYTTNGSDPTESSSAYSSAIPLTSTTTIKAKAFKSGYTASSVASATYTNSALTTMDAIYTAATAAGGSATSVCITFNNWVVSGASSNGRNVYVTDGTKGFLIYGGSDTGFRQGDILSGSVSCSIQMYNNAAELTSLTTSTTGLTVTKGGSVSPTTLDESGISALTGVNTGRVITTTGVCGSCNSTKQCINGAQLYDQLYSYSATNGTTYTVTGVYVRFGTTQEILPLSDLTTYTITATRNNNDYGTVSVSGTTITATPASGYKVMSGTDGYTVVSGTATVTNNGDNTFTVSPSSDCTIRINFESKGCTDKAGTNVTSGSTTSNKFGPVATYYKYSTRQILYTKTDLDLAAGKKGTIKSIYFDAATDLTARNITIYMANSSITALSTSNYVPYGDFTQVFTSSSWACSTGWNEIELTTPFEYNGLGNLVVLIDDNSNFYKTTEYFNCHTATTTTGAQIWAGDDVTNENPSSTTWSSYTEENTRPNTKFCIEVKDMVAATVTLMDNSATLTEASVGAGVTLPSRTGCTEYTFAGWTKSWVAEQDEWTTTAPTIIPAGSYYPSSNENLYPVYTKSEGEYVSVTGGDMSSGLTTGWYTATAGTYSSGNGVKFDDEGDWILSDDFSSENLTKVTVKFKAGNDGAAGSILRFEAIDEAGYEITGVDFSPTDTYDGQSTVNTVVIDASEKIYTVAVELTSKTNNVGMKYCEVFKGGPTISYISVPDCCDKNITIGDPIITGSGDVAFTYGGDAISAGDVVETCKAAQEVVATVTPEMGYECTSLTFSGGSVSVSPTPGSGNYPAYPSTYDYTLSFDKNTTSATLSTSATFTAKSVTGWTWKQELADASEITIPSTVELYVGQQARFNLKSYTPDVIEDNKGYSASYTSADLAQDSKAGAYYVTRAKIVKESTTLTLTSTNNALVQQVITIRIKALPLVHFVDKIHGVEFADVVANVDATEKRTVYTTKPTPTHSDVSDPGSNYNSCEQQHLHLVGWILSTWADANPGATHLQIIGAGSGTYYAAGADIDVEAQNTKTFYAVWGHEVAE